MLSNIPVRNFYFIYTFNPTPKIDIQGSAYETPYEMFLKIDFSILDKKRNQMNTIMSRSINPPGWYGSQMFSFYVPWVLTTSTWSPEYGFQVVDYHQYSDYNKDVQIRLHTDDWEQMCTWIKVCFDYKNLHHCQLNFAVSNKELQRRAVREFGISFLDMEDEMMNVYSTYDIGRFEQPRDAGHILSVLDDNQEQIDIPNPYPEAYPAGKRFVETNMVYSGLNPRDPNNLSDEDVAKDILGLSDWELF